MDSDAYDQAADVEQRHWWFRGRRAVLAAVFRRISAARAGPMSILEAGCGNGGNLALLARFGSVVAFEPHAKARARAAARDIATVLPGSLPGQVPFPEDGFDLVVALDVIEHLKEDVAAVATLLRQLKTGGRLVLTVPAHMWLWSEHDTLSHHCQRYSAAGLRAALERAGCEVHYVTFFNTVLMLPAALYILLCRVFRWRASAALAVPIAPVNNMLTAAFAAESLLVPRIRLPWGVSLLAVVGRRGEDRLSRGRF
jgi:SAM-dependent methyltransferase